MKRKWLTMLAIAISFGASAQPRLPKNYYWQKLDN